MFELQGGRIEVPGRVLIEKADMHVERGEHVTLVGGNGSGKTTLIQTLTGRAELPEGKLSTGHNVHLGYVSQHAEGLSEDGSLLDATQRATGLTPGKARALLGMFLFSGDEAEKPVAGLSGGERQRFSLAVLVNSGANMLVLDEPTNHLDLESREALEDALRGLPRIAAAGEPRPRAAGRGGLAHGRDRGRLAEQLRGRLGRVPGGARGARGGGQAAAPRQEAEGQDSRSPSQPVTTRKLERQIEEAEAALAEDRGRAGRSSAWNDPRTSAKSQKRHADAKRRVDELYEQLEAVALSRLTPDTRGVASACEERREGCPFWMSRI